LETTDIHTLSLISQINWRPGIGDPTIVGWLTAIAYFVTFLFSVVCARRLAGINLLEKVAVQQKLWWFISVALLLLGINKQLDIQTLITEVGKVLAKRQGWYEQRRTVQMWFIAGVVFSGAFSLILVWRTLQNVWKENGLTLFGMVFLVSFIVIRATSFHGVDRILGLEFSGFKMNWILELGGIICIWFSTILLLKKTARKSVCIETEQRINFL
jgi:hypothetical protein